MTGATLALLVAAFVHAEEPFVVPDQVGAIVSQMRKTGQGQGPLVEAARRANSGVVSIAVKTLERRAEGFNETTGPEGATGSGFVVDAAKGLIVTNAHVVKGIGRNGWRLEVDEHGASHNVEVLRSRVTVSFQDDAPIEAEVIDFNEREDLALVQVEPARAGRALTALKFGDDRDLAVGSPVIAIGSPLSMTDTTTFGHVSKLRHTFAGHSNVIQHDAAVNPGNSGGPLVDLQGRVVGVNTWITSPTRQFQGLAYAIPISLVKEMLARFARDGHIHDTAVGLTIEPFHLGGIRVVSILPGSPAAASQDLFAGDIIIAIDGRQVYRTDRPAGDESDLRISSFLAAVRAHKPGDTVQLTVLRGGLLDPFRVQVDLKTY